MLLLEGVRIISVEQYGAGPFGTLQLADLGADVIKIEDRAQGGDMGRGVPPFAGDGDSLFFQSFNRGKRSVTLDLRTAAGQEALRRLAANADVVFSNLRGDLPETLRLTYDHLKDVNRRLVCVSLSGYGTSGPRRAEPAYDYLIQGQIGLMALTGDPDGPPERAGMSVMDYNGGLMAMIGLLAGVISARATGTGRDIEISLLDAGLSLLNYLAAWTLNREYVPLRTAESAHPSLVPSQLFPTADGYLVVMCNKEKFFPLLCAKLGLPDLPADPRFTNFAARLENRDTLIPILKSAFSSATTAHWLRELRGLPVAPVNDITAALRLADERGMLVDVEHPRYGTLREIGSPFHAGGHRPATPAGAMGADTDAVLAEVAGFTPAEIARLRAEGAL